jgi:signal transduction histidine kinase/ActR/RegA family two-component response regulator
VRRTDEPARRDDGNTSGLVDEVTRLRADLARERARTSEAERARDQALMALAGLREADRRKDEFLAMLGHELRNPLAPIMMAVELLRLRLPTTPEVERIRDVIERQVHHLTRLVDDLLEVSRITLGKIRLDKQVIDARSVVARAVETTRPNFEARKHTLSLDLPAQPISIDGDPVRLAQVLGNLLNNAAKYTQEGGHILLAVSRDGGDVVFRVKDDGIGLTAEMLDRVFDLFAQSDRSIDRSEGGLGIGLTLARRLVEMHDGAIGGASEGLGRGSEFTVRIPALADESAVVVKAQKPAKARGTAHLRALVVDDNVDAAEMLAALLESLGHEVRVVHDGGAALEAARELTPDIVMLDIGLPRMDGFEVARRLRERADHVPLLVAITGYGQHDDRQRSLAAGFDHHLVKPVDRAAIESLLEKTRAEG